MDYLNYTLKVEELTILNERLIKKEIFELINEKEFSYLLLGFSCVKYMDSSGMSLLLNICKKFPNKIYFYDFNPQVYELASITNIISFFLIFENEESAINATKEKN